MNPNFSTLSTSGQLLYGVGQSSPKMGLMKSGTSTGVLSPVQIAWPKTVEIKRMFGSFETTFVETVNGKLLMLSENLAQTELTPVPFTNQALEETRNHTLVDASCCDTLWIFLFSNHRVYGFGSKIANSFNTDPHKLTRISSDVHGDIIHCTVGYYHTYFLNSEHKVFSFGQGQGLGRKESSSTGQITRFNKVLKPNDYVIKLSSGYAQLVALTHQGFAYFHGYGSHGEGAMNLSPNKPTLVTWFSDSNILLKDISCGIFHTMWLTRDNQLYISGRNHEGELGVDFPDSSTKTPQLVVIDRPICTIRAGSTSSFIFTEDNHIYFCGSFCYLSNVANDVHKKMTDLLQLVQTQHPNSPEQDEFAALYNNRNLAIDCAVGSSHHFILFRHKATPYKHLYQAAKNHKFVDFEIITQR